MRKIPIKHLKKRLIPWYRSIVTKQFLIFVVLLIPIYLICFLIYQWGSKSLEEEVWISTSTQDHKVVNELQRQIQTLQEMQNDIFEARDLLLYEGNPSGYSVFEKSQMALRIQEKLVMIINSSPLVSEAQLYIPSIQMKISSGFITPFDSSILDKLMEQRENACNLKYEEEALHSIISYQGVYSGKYPKYIFDITLSNYRINKMLDELNTDQSCAALYNSSLGYCYFRSSDTGPAKDEVELPEDYRNANAKKYKIGEVDYVRNMIYNESLDLTLIHYQPYSENFQKLQTFTEYFYTLMGINILIIGAFLLYIYGFIRKPVYELVGAFDEFKGGNLKTRIQYRQKDEFKLIADNFNSMAAEWERMLEKDYNQKMLVQKAELKQLQSQIDPHFLYNSFFILSRRVENGENSQAVQFCNQLGEYFRFVNRNGADEVTLSKERQHTKNYTDIQMNRFHTRISVQFGEIPEGLETLKVPRLIMQPIVENAFEHGLKEKECDGILSIQFLENDNFLEIKIEENGDFLSEESLKHIQKQLSQDETIEEISAIFNINRRLKILYGEECGIFVSRSSFGGMKVTLKLRVEESGCIEL